MHRKMLMWKTCCGVAVALGALAMSPLVLTPGRFTPELFGLPRTLWLGILIAFALVLLSAIGGMVHPANEADDHGDEEC